MKPIEKSDNTNIRRPRPDIVKKNQERQKAKQVGRKYTNELKNKQTSKDIRTTSEKTAAKTRLNKLGVKQSTDNGEIRDADKLKILNTLDYLLNNSLWLAPNGQTSYLHNPQDLESTSQAFTTGATNTASAILTATGASAGLGNLARGIVGGVAGSEIAPLISDNKYASLYGGLMGGIIGGGYKPAIRFIEGKLINSHLLGKDAVRMFKEYGGEPIPEGSINGELLRKYVPEARERYGLVGNTDITDEEIAQALYKHVKELGGNTAAVNALGEPLLLFRGDTRPYTQLRTNHHESGGTEDNILGTLFLDRTGIGEGWGPDRYLYLANKNGEVMAPYRSGIEVGDFSTLEPSFKDGYLYDLSGKGFVLDDLISYPYWSHTGRNGDVISGSKISSDSFVDGKVNHLNAFIVRTPAVRDITNEVIVTGGKPGTPPPFSWLIPKENRIGSNLHDVRLALNRAVLQEAEKQNQGLLKSNRGSFWRGEEHEGYDYFALPDRNAKNAKHILPYDLRIPRNWSDPNIYRSILPFALGSSALYGITSNQKGGKLIRKFINNKQL